ncbi:hypothetical protein [Corynebacterium glyciniphilum]|nr:hypothetical protein [Corynebacterium glyciniphilum]
MTTIHGEALTVAALRALNTSELEGALDTGIAVVVTGAQAREIRRRMYRP